MSGGTRRVAVKAPAKLNLGLEVLGWRDDGYHELATIFLAIDLCDELVLSEVAGACPHPPTPPPRGHPARRAGRGGPSTESGFEQGQCFSGEVSFDERPGGREFVEEPNLALRALRVFGEEAGLRGGARVSLKKRIPVAAGLGGASSDAAAVLVAARELWGVEIGDEQVAEIAARLGSDVPFFLQGGCALGRGRGEELTALPVPEDLWFVAVAPEVTVPRKTATLFANLEPGDFSDGSRIEVQAARLRDGLGLDAGLLGNAFARALYRIVPELGSLQGMMREAGAETVAITGAGPAHYAVVEDGPAAERIAARLRQRLGDWARVFVARPV